MEISIDVVVGGIIVLLILLIRMRGSSWKMKKMPACDHIFGYELIYADQKSKNDEDDFGRLLYSAKYDLQGKPDYVFRSRLGRNIVPVELKSGKIGEDLEPHRGDMLQLGAYFLILEDVYHRKPKQGRLVYQDHMFLIKNTRAIRKEVLRTAQEMRSMLVSGQGQANQSFATCRYCMCNGTVCEHSDTKIDGGK